MGISNQRETTAMWDRETGEPLEQAVVWQCGRAAGIVRDIANRGFGSIIREKTGIPLSAYFPAAKMAWLLQTDEKNGNGRKKAGSVWERLTAGLCGSSHRSMPLKPIIPTRPGPSF